MIDPASLAARYAHSPEQNSTGWALELLTVLYSRNDARRRPSRGHAGLRGFSVEAMSELRRRKIGTRLENYGQDWTRFENALGRVGTNGPRSHPLVSVPSAAAVNWADGSLHIQPRTFVVTYEGNRPVFLTRDLRSPEVLKVSLRQMRLLHRTWAAWPVVLPSMHLEVLWHWRLG